MLTKAIGQLRPSELYVGKIGQIKEFRADSDRPLFIWKREALLDAQVDVLEPLVAVGVPWYQHAVDDGAVGGLPVSVLVDAGDRVERPARRESR